MPGDVLDSAKIAEAVSGLDKMNDSASAFDAKLDSMRNTFDLFANVAESSLTLQIRSFKDANAAMETMAQTSEQLNKNTETLTSLLTNLNKLYEKQAKTKEAGAKTDRKILVDYNSLSIMEQLRVANQARRAKIARQVVSINGEEVNIGQRRLQQEDKFKQTVKGTAEQATGLNISFMGVVAMIIDAYNEMRKIGAMSQQIATQWQGGNEHLGKATELIGEIRGKFAKSYEEAGKYVGSLSKAGFAMEDISKMNSEVLAVNELNRLSTNDQLDLIRQLQNEFGLTNDEARDFSLTLQQVAIDMRGPDGLVISMEEVVADVMDLANKTKAYNVDLLGTVSLYSTLMREGVSKQLGLEGVPKEMKKNMAVTVAGMQNDLSWGLKAALGEAAGVGGNVLQKALSFEKMADPQKFTAMLKFMAKQIESAPLDIAEVKVRELSKMLGFGAGESKAIAEMFTKGGLNEANIQDLSNTFDKERQSAKKLSDLAKTGRERLIKAGQSVSHNLQTIQNVIKKFVEDHIIKLINAIFELVDAISNWSFFGTNAVERKKYKEDEKKRDAEDTRRANLIEKTKTQISEIPGFKSSELFRETSRIFKEAGEADPEEKAKQLILNKYMDKLGREVRDPRISASDWASMTPSFVTKTSMKSDKEIIRDILDLVQLKDIIRSNVNTPQPSANYDLTTPPSP